MKKVCGNWEALLPAGAPDPALFADFATRATAVSAEVVPVADAAGVAEVLLRLIRETGAVSVVAAECPIQEAASTTKILRENGVQVHTGAQDIAAHAATADIGLSGVEFGVAETGSLFVDAIAAESRLVSTLPPIHVAVLPAGRIVPDIAAAIEILAKTFTHGYMSFITGPSRTADIERVLTIGVHGPSRLIIIAVGAV